MGTDLYERAAKALGWADGLPLALNEQLAERIVALAKGRDEAASTRDELRVQINDLAAFIMHEVKGEPSRSEGAVDTAIRIMRTLKKERDRFAAALTAIEHHEPGGIAIVARGFVAADTAVVVRGA